VRRGLQVRRALRNPAIVAHLESFARAFAGLRYRLTSVPALPLDAMAMGGIALPTRGFLIPQPTETSADPGAVVGLSPDLRPGRAASYESAAHWRGGSGAVWDRSLWDEDRAP
jgi:hypothetical protein